MLFTATHIPTLLVDIRQEKVHGEGSRPNVEIYIHRVLCVHVVIDKLRQFNLDDESLRNLSVMTNCMLLAKHLNPHSEPCPREDKYSPLLL
jgi:hypothetical protein